MIERMKEKWLLSLLTVAMFYFGLSKAGTVFDVTDTSPILFFVLAVSFISCVFDQVVIRFILYIPTFILCLYGIERTNTSSTLSTFILNWLNSLSSIFNGMIMFAESYSLIMLTFILLVSLFLIEWQISVEVITPQVFFFVGYLLLLNEFNEIKVTNTVILIVCIYFVERLVVYSDKLINPTLIVSLVCVLLLGGVNIYSQSTQIRRSLTDASIPLRKYATEKGLYAYINERKTRFLTFTGFSEDDSLLGGPIKDNQAIAFQVKQKEPKYWRVDSKTEYTGSGWQSSEKRTETNLTPYLYINDTGFKGAYKEPENIDLKLYYNETYFPISYGTILKNEEQQGVEFKYDEENGRVDLNAPVRNEDITLSIASPIFDEKELKKATLVVPDEKYLQLPNKFPNRIKELTQEVTKDKKTLYDKVKAVEQYLKTSSEYSYSKSGARHTPDDTDYVDFFLFESKVGYCNNFSTSMSVMLRSIGIPTRWVKGFNQGEVKEKDGEMTVYNVRNSNAHSWVEVYFEGSGWVPFEPTPSFTGTSIVKQETDVDETPSTDKKTNESQTTNNSQKDNTRETTNDSKRKITIFTTIKEFFSNNKKRIKFISQIIVLVLIILILMYVFKNRYYLVILISMTVFKKPFYPIYQLLLKQLQSKVYREPSLSLSQYTNQLCTQYEGIEELKDLTDAYQQLAYGGSTGIDLTDNFKEKILRLSKKITSLKKVS